MSTEDTSGRSDREPGDGEEGQVATPGAVAVVAPISTIPTADVNPDLLEQVVAFGYDRELAARALLATGNSSADAAVCHLLDSDDPNWEDVDDRDQRLANTMTYKMVFVVNSSLKMGIGKTAAQVGHATLGVYRAAANAVGGTSALNKWAFDGETKIVVRVDTTEQLIDLQKKSADVDVVSYIVHDAGRTQVPSGSTTVLGLFGATDQVDSITGQLQLI